MSDVELARLQDDGCPLVVDATPEPSADCERMIFIADESTAFPAEIDWFGVAFVSSVVAGL